MKDHRRIIFCFGASLLVIAPLLTAQSRPLSGADASELAAGKRVFDSQCAWCHGTDGTGGAGPSLQRSDLRHASTDADLTSILKNMKISTYEAIMSAAEDDDFDFTPYVGTLENDGVAGRQLGQ
jgi:mono/diheme cytochrome c family protein